MSRTRGSLLALPLLLAGCGSPMRVPPGIESRNPAVRTAAVVQAARDEDATLAWKLRLLVPLLDDPDPGVRGAARARVSRLLVAHTPWSACEWLGSEGSPHEKIHLVLAFRGLGRPMDGALDPLRAIARDPARYDGERCEAEAALCVLGEPPDGVVERFAARLDRHEAVGLGDGRLMVFALSRLGPAAAAAAPSLRRLRARDPTSAFVLEDALARIESPPR